MKHLKLFNESFDQNMSLKEHAEYIEDLMIHLIDKWKLIEIKSEESDPALEKINVEEYDVNQLGYKITTIESETYGQSNTVEVNFYSSIYVSDKFYHEFKKDTFKFAGILDQNNYESEMMEDLGLVNYNNVVIFQFIIDLVDPKDFN